MGHGQVRVDALIQDEMAKQRSMNILSYWMGFGDLVLLHRNEMQCRDKQAPLRKQTLPDQGQTPFSSWPDTLP